MQNFSLNLLQQAMNHYIALDEGKKSKLLALEAKVLKIETRPINLGFYMRFQNQQIQLLKDYAGEADCSIESSPLALIRLGLSPNSKIHSLFQDKLSMRGDVELGQAVKDLFNLMDLDWEAYLAQYTGDAAAHHLGNIVNKAKDFTLKRSEASISALSEYLQEEKRLLPPAEALQDFYNEVDELAMRCERLSAQIEQLKSKA